MMETGSEAAYQTGGLTLDRSMNLDLEGFLEMELPELHEFIPVDSFFGEYVNGLELGAHEGQQHMEHFNYGALQVPTPALAAPSAFSNGYNTGPVAPRGAHHDMAMQVNGDHASTAILSGMYPTTMNQSAAQPMMMEQPHVYGSATAMMPPIITTGETPMTSTPGASDSHVPVHATAKRGRPRGPTRGGRRQVLARSDSSGSGEGSMLHMDRGGDKTKRNSKQQLQNKQAQQRYRERRKQRFSELELALDQLELQVQGERNENAELAARNEVLQGHATNLEVQLASKEAEVVALAAEIQQPSNSSSSVLGLPEGDGLEKQEVTEWEVGKSSGHQLSDAEAAAIQSTFTMHVMKVKAFVDEHDLCRAPPLGDGLDPRLMSSLQELVESGWKNVQMAVRAGGVKVLDLMGRDAEGMGQMTCEVKRARWARILEAVRLAPAQQDALLLLREQHLAKLHDVYRKRQSLNMQAMALMLPEPGDASRCPEDSRLQGDPSVEGKMACMSISGYAACAKSNIALDSVLDAIKENLRLEQKTVMQMQFLVMLRLLSPLQSALFLVEAYPARPDALALSNICAQAMNTGTEVYPKAAEILEPQNRQEHMGAQEQPSTTDLGFLKGESAEEARLRQQYGSSGSGAQINRLEDRTSGDSHHSDIFNIC